MTQISDDDFNITDDEIEIAVSELDFTKEEIKGIVVAPAPKSSKYAEQSVIVGVYFDNKSDKPRMYNGHPFYPSVLFGAGNYDRIYLGRLMNVEYVPLNKANDVSLFGYLVVNVHHIFGVLHMHCIYCYYGARKVGKLQE